MSDRNIIDLEYDLSRSLKGMSNSEDGPPGMVPYMNIY